MIKKLIVSLIVAALLFTSGALFSQDESASKKKSLQDRRISLEFYGGLNLANPAELNLLVKYEGQWLDFNYSKYYDYYHSLSGNLYTYTSEGDGSDAFREIKALWPLGVRLLYSLNQTFSVSLGLQYVRGSRTSDLATTYQVKDLRPDQRIFPNSLDVEIKYPELYIQAQGFSPQAGIHAGRQLSRGLRLEGFLTGGPLFVRCRNIIKSNIKTTYEKKWWRENSFSQELKGSGTGLSLEGGARIKIGIFKRGQFFCEGGYALRRVGKVKGSLHSESQVSDANAAQDTQIIDYEGDWRVYEATRQDNWGTWKIGFVSPYLEPGSGVRDLKLDLSGFQIKIGLAWTF